MTDSAQVLVKDLRSTGYFFEELKDYSRSAEMNIHTYSRNYVIPYLIRLAESHRESGHPERSRILDSAAELLSDAGDDELIESLFAIKKIANSEIEINERLLSEIGRHNKSQVLTCYQKSESAKRVLKLMVNIIKMFRLPEVTAKRDKSRADAQPVESQRGTGLKKTSDCEDNSDQGTTNECK